MSSINHYDCLVNYAQQKNLPIFREHHFQQWSITEPGCCYCVSREGTWNFFGFVPRPNRGMLLVAVNKKKEFLYYRPDATTLQKKVDGQKQLWNIPHEQSWQASLLDFTQVHPLFLSQLAWKVMPGSLEMWDDDRNIILITQLARTLGHIETDLQMDLTGALFDFMEKPILKLLVNEFTIATLGDYQFLWEAEDLVDQQERIKSLSRHPGLVPRFILADL